MIPIKSNYVAQNLNWGNYLIIAICILTYCWERTTNIETIERFAFNPVTYSGLVTSIFLHGGLLHLAGNMLVLNVFGKAVIDKVGNATYVCLYVFMGVVANIFYAFFNTHLALGASGAISGVVAMSLMLMPFVDIKTIFWFLPPIIFDIASFWIAGIWFAMDLWSFSDTQDKVGYQAHIGGFICGILLSYLIIKTNRITYRGSERSFIGYFLGQDEIPTKAFLAVPIESCTNCGNRISSDSKRCGNCGFSFTKRHNRIDQT